MSTEHDIGYGWTLKQENEEELEVVYITLNCCIQTPFLSTSEKRTKGHSLLPN